MEPSIPTLTDGRVTLRAPHPHDVVGCYEQCIDPTSIRWTQVPVPYTLDDARDFCLEAVPKAWAQGSQWIFVVEAERAGLPAGTRGYCGNIALRDEGHGRAEIAFGAHPGARGTGVMEAALRLLVEWGFAEQGVRTIIWRAEVGNWASRKLAWRLGLSLDGVLRGSLPSRGELLDGWVGTLLADEPRTPRTRWLPIPTLEADGVRLRAPRESDLARVMEACRDERTGFWLRTPRPYTETHARTWITQSAPAGAADGEKVIWAVADPDSDLLLGYVELFNIGDFAANVGFWAHPDARGRGVTTRATRAALTWGRDELGLRVVEAHAGVENTASRHALESAGMSFGGIVPLGTRTTDGPTDAAVYYLRW